jgi:MoaA/NifB/PqqE/SkfB family radical SAM enzyme
MRKTNNIKEVLSNRLSGKPGYNTLLKCYRKLISIKNSISYYAKPNPVSLSLDTVKEYNSTRTHSVKHICNAPFSNLYFGYGGKIGVCCYNRTHILGNYPEISISEAWNSEKLEELQQKINVVDLTSGCYCCQVQWVEHAFQTVLAKNYDGIIPQKKYPVSMEFELSNKCNLACIMCSEENSSFIANKRFGEKEKLHPYDDEFVEQLKVFIPHIQVAKFLGGEPLLIPIYYKIWDLFAELNRDAKIVIQTNGTIINDKIKTMLEDGNFSISISIDSFVKETYESIRLNANFDKTFDNLNYFIDLCKRKNNFIGIAACFIQQNWQEIPEMIRFCNQKQIPITFNRVWEPPSCSIWESSYELTSEILSFYKTINFDFKTEIERKNIAAFNDLISLVESWNNHEKLKYEEQFSKFNQPIDKLESLVLKHVLEEKTFNLFTENEKAIIQTKISKTLDIFSNHNAYKSFLIKILEIPPEIMQRELLNNSQQRIEQQITDILKEYE